MAESQKAAGSVSVRETSSLHEKIGQCMLRDRFALRSRLRGIESAIRNGRDAESLLAAFKADLERSAARCADRRKNLPAPTYPEDLPVVQRRDEIARAIAENQVIVLCGETGSGKTTQLPKICLELGRGVAGMIGHTQPRRIAARSVAMRLASELQSPLGQAVGYKVRFSDKLSAGTYVKLMTDGILLAETQGDRFLESYDTIIIDEAHERSLNIDFLLGYLKQLLPKRPDLKLIITSATIDPQRFSRHFNDAPIVTVSGRTYPVEVRYRPIAAEEEDEEDPTVLDAIVAAVDELWRSGPGDVLIFLSGEREIREAAQVLRGHHPQGTEILPLYGRLSADEQMRIFQPHDRPRLVLATNVAETSLTVPGIKYVIDPGYARISRYSPRTKVQRLPIERISQASANQRSGRCGRISEGICIRLYSEDDFAGRSQFTEPEILRTNLASVILQMKALRLGEIQDFPFVEPPDYRSIKDGFQTLHELGAIDDRNELTPLGLQLARLPIDPRIARMIVAAQDENCLDEVLVIAAAMSIQDPRDRPMDKPEAADASHAKFRDERSDFITYLNLWRWYHEQARHLSGSKLRKLCRENFLSYVRMREWHDIHGQLQGLVSHTKHNLMPALPPARFDAVHRAVLSGLLSNIGQKTDAHEYTGARGTKFFIFPGSALFKAKPNWVMAGELVETTKLYARTVAAIRPEWVERLAEHIVKRTYSDPHWSPQTGHVVAYAKVTLYGLPIVPRRTVHYGPIDPKLSREIFIKGALVDGDSNISAPFFRHNQRLVDEIQTLEAKTRQRGLLVEADARFDFYDAKIPPQIHNVPAFQKWLAQVARDNPKFLFMSRRDLLQSAGDFTQENFPDTISVNAAALPLEYHFEPGHAADGVTVAIPLALLNQLPAERFEWVVPGLLREKITALIKSLPKPLRVQFVPAPEVAQAAMQSLKSPQGSLLDALSVFLGKHGGVAVTRGDFDPQSLLEHLHMNFKVVDESGKVLAWGRDLDGLRRQLGREVRRRFNDLPQSPFVRDGIVRWDFDDLPESIEVVRQGMALRAYPAIVENPQTPDAVSLRLFDTKEAAAQAMRGGLRRLFIVQLGGQFRQLQQSLPNIEQMCLNYSTLGTCDQLSSDIMIAAADRALFDDEEPLIRTREQFVARAEAGWRNLAPAANGLAGVADEVLSLYHQLSLDLTSRLPPLMTPALDDLRAQLRQVVPKDFVVATPRNWLSHLPRFLHGMQARLKKLTNAGVARDTQGMEIVRPYQDRLDERLQHRLADPELVEYRWMLQELRVSLFAQELKTSIPISTQRLEKQWAKVRAP